jgi:hypothetical protein
LRVDALSVPPRRDRWQREKPRSEHPHQRRQQQETTWAESPAAAG